MARLAKEIKMRDIRSVVLVARGTSDNAANYGRYLLAYLMHVPISLAAPSLVTLYKAETDFTHSLVIGISQSGEGPDICEVVRSATKQGALTVGITNEANSRLSKESTHTIFLNAGPERSVAATKTYMGQLAVLYLLGTIISGDKNSQQALMSIPWQIEKVLSLRNQIKVLSQRFAYLKECTVIGRGFNYSTALETALKLKECCQLGAQPYSSVDFQHGPLAVVNPGYLVLLFASQGPTLPGLTQLVRDLRGHGADVLSISPDRRLLNLSTFPIHVPVTNTELASPFLMAPVGQLLSYYIACSKGLDPDKPRSLKKVTKTL